jgi:hypothetical protein
MKPTDAAGLHRAMFAAIDRRELDASRGLFAVDATHTSSDGEPMTGPEPVIDEVRAFVEARLAPPSPASSRLDPSRLDPSRGRAGARPGM